MRVRSARRATRRVFVGAAAAALAVGGLTVAARADAYTDPSSPVGDRCSAVSGRYTLAYNNGTTGLSVDWAPWTNGVERITARTDNGWEGEMGTNHLTLQQGDVTLEFWFGDGGPHITGYGVSEIFRSAASRNAGHLPANGWLTKEAFAC